MRVTGNQRVGRWIRWLLILLWFYLSIQALNKRAPMATGIIQRSINGVYQSQEPLMPQTLLTIGTHLRRLGVEGSVRTVEVADNEQTIKPHDHRDRRMVITMEDGSRISLDRRLQRDTVNPQESQGGLFIYGPRGEELLNASNAAANRSWTGTDYRSGQGQPIINAALTAEAYHGILGAVSDNAHLLPRGPRARSPLAP
jgi:hypothetical protein